MLRTLSFLRKQESLKNMDSRFRGNDSRTGYSPEITSSCVTSDINSCYASVIPAEAGICEKTWIPAFAGMTAGQDIRLNLADVIICAFCHSDRMEKSFKILHSVRNGRKKSANYAGWNYNLHQFPDSALPTVDK
jgi:hypothetical protein